jgi:hypothetical protein
MWDKMIPDVNEVVFVAQFIARRNIGSLIRWMMDECLQRTSVLGVKECQIDFARVFGGVIPKL